MSLSRFIFKGSGVEEILNSATTRAMLTGKAQGVLAAAKSAAPVDTGAYAESLTIVQDTTDRAAVRVSAGVSYGGVVEANTGTLARALDAAK